MRIFYDGIVFSLQQTGGISVLFTELIARLPAPEYRFIGYRANLPAGIHASSYEQRSSRPLERYRRVSTGSEFDLFHSTYYRLPAEHGVPVVTSVYDFVYERYAPFHRRIPHSLQKQAAIAGANRIICLSESTKRDLAEFAGQAAADRAVVVYLAASLAFQPSGQRTPLPQVLFVGSRGGYKNFAALVHALAPLRDLSLLCVGGGPFTAEETALLDRNLDRRYRSAGFLPIEELNHEYNQSLCLVYPSRYEGFGIPILEAMQAGCPVVAVDCSSIPEVAGDAALLVDKGEPDELRAAVLALFSEPLRSALIHKGLVQSAGFTWDRTAQQTIAVYKELLT